MSFLLKTYEVRVEGFASPVRYLGRTPSQARADAWRSYTHCSDVSFRDFLKISTIKRAADAEGFGRPIVVGDQPAHWCGYNGQYVLFVRPDSAVVMLSHPLDVSEVAA